MLCKCLKLCFQVSQFYNFNWLFFIPDPMIFLFFFIYFLIFYRYFTIFPIKRLSQTLFMQYCCNTRTFINFTAFELAMYNLILFSFSGNLQKGFLWILWSYSSYCCYLDLSELHPSYSCWTLPGGYALLWIREITHSRWTQKRGNLPPFCAIIANLSNSNDFSL